MINIKECQDKLNEVKGRKKSIQDNIKKLRKEKKENEVRIKNIEIAQVFIQKVAQDTQNKLKFQIEDIVQLALNSCFPGQYNFSVDFEIKRGQTEASLKFMRDGNPVNPMDSSGGGAVDIAAFALRISAWSLGKSSSILLLDEPFRFLSRDLHEAAGNIMKMLSEKLKLQVIMITHNSQMEVISDRVFKVSLDLNKISQVKIIRKS